MVKDTMREKTYQGYTRKELINKFIYDPDQGIFYNRKTKRPMKSTKDGRLVIISRVQDKLITLSAARVALIVVDDRFLESSEVIQFLDSNPCNLKYDNLGVSDKISNLKKGRVEAPNAIATEEEGIFKVMPKGFFVVRRGPKQAVYRTYSMEEAVKIRDEWLNNPEIHRWDYSYPEKIREILVET